MKKTFNTPRELDNFVDRVAKTEKDKAKLKKHTVINQNGTMTVKLTKNGRA